MKKVWNSIFKNFSILDYILLVLAIAVPVIVCNFFKTNVTVMLAGIGVAVATVFALKKTYHGYLLMVAAVSWLGYYLFKLSLYGSFASCVFIAIIALVKFVMLFVKKAGENKKLNLYDWLTIIVGMVIVVVPIYLFFVVGHCASPIFETAEIVSTLTISYFVLMNKECGSLYLVPTALSLTGIVLLLNKNTITNIITLGTVFIILVVEGIKVLSKKKVASKKQK